VQIGLVPVILPQSELKELMRSAESGSELTVDLEGESIAASDHSISFEMDPFVRHCLLNGLDAIARTLEHESDIAAFESRTTPRIETTAL
jgi:3-isopropylmalate dehydratase small subunit